MAKSALLTPNPAVPDTEIALLDPAQILADPEGNTRYGLKPERVAHMVQDISEHGLLSPVEVEPYNLNGYNYRLTFGFYRYAALAKLGRKVPAIVRTLQDSTDRLQRQISENVARETQSPMDLAVSIQRLQDAGVPNLEIRRMFSRPGGRKGATLQPASNTWISMTRALQSLPKSIQDKIHDGRIGIAAAYEIVRVAPEKREAVLDRVEAERQAALAQEEADERRLLASLAEGRTSVSKAPGKLQQKHRAKMVKQALRAKRKRIPAAEKATKAIGPTEVRKAAKKEGALATKALTLAAFRAQLSMWSNTESHPVVGPLCRILLDGVSGRTSPKAMYARMVKHLQWRGSHPISGVKKTAKSARAAKATTTGKK